MSRDTLANPLPHPCGIWSHFLLFDIFSFEVSELFDPIERLLKQGSDPYFIATRWIARLCQGVLRHLNTPKY